MHLSNFGKCPRAFPCFFFFSMFRQRCPSAGPLLCSQPPLLGGVILLFSVSYPHNRNVARNINLRVFCWCRFFIFFWGEYIHTHTCEVSDQHRRHLRARRTHTNLLAHRCCTYCCRSFYCCTLRIRSTPAPSVTCAPSTSPAATRPRRRWPTSRTAVASSWT